MHLIRAGPNSAVTYYVQLRGRRTTPDFSMASSHVDCETSHSSKPSDKDGGRRKRASAFSYSRVRDKTTQLRTGLRTKSDTDGASTTINGSSGRDMLLSTSYPDCNTGSSSAATTSSTASSSAVTSDGRDVMKYNFVDELPDDCCCGMCGEV